MIGADETTVDNNHYQTIAIFRGPDREEKATKLKQAIHRFGISMDRNPQDIRNELKRCGWYN